MFSEKGYGLTLWHCYICLALATLVYNQMLTSSSWSWTKISPTIWPLIHKNQFLLAQIFGEWQYINSCTHIQTRVLVHGKVFAMCTWTQEHHRNKLCMLLSSWLFQRHHSTLLFWSSDLPLDLLKLSCLCCSTSAPQRVGPIHCNGNSSSLCYRSSPIDRLFEKYWSKYKTLPLPLLQRP